MWKCSRCKKFLSEEQFYKDNSSSRGYDYMCKLCNRAEFREYYVNNMEKLAARDRLPARRFKKSIRDAKRRYLSWALTQEEYCSLIKLPCYYCNSLPDSNVTGIGLDRLDSTQGYALVNVVPCCGPCNVGRNINFTPEEWKIDITAVIAYRGQCKS